MKYFVVLLLDEELLFFRKILSIHNK